MAMGLSTQPLPLNPRPSFASYSLFSRQGGGCTFHHDKNYNTKSFCWRLKCIPLCYSTPKMVPCYIDEDNSNGSHVKKPITDPQKVDKEGEHVLRSFSGPPSQESGDSNSHRRGAFGTRNGLRVTLESWKREAEMMRITREHELEVFKRGSDSPYKTCSQAKILSSSGGILISTPSDIAPPESASDPASTEVECGGDGNVAAKDVVNGIKIDQSRKGLCSTDNIKETNSGLNRGLIKPSTGKQAYCQPDLHERLGSIYDSVLVVDDVTIAKEVVGMLTNKYRHLVHACDTEVAKIDVKQETPVDHGEIICFSIYSGPEVDFGNGKSFVWVDVLDGGDRDLLIAFAPFFEDPSIKKVWHNYSFDNHVIENYGLKVSGFHADTMHMARLWDSSRRTMGGYSLEALTGDKRVMSGAELCHEKELFGKVSMKTIFGRRKLKKTMDRKVK